MATATLVEPSLQYRHLRAAVQTTGKGQVVAIFNSSDVDQHGTVLMPGGCDYSHYMTTSRSVTWEHGGDQTRGRIPVAITQSITRTKDGLVGEFQFRDDPFSREVYEAYKDGSAKGFSVEFPNPPRSDWSKPTSEEIRAHPSWKGAIVLRNWQLSGISTTMIPSNPSSLTLEVRSAPRPSLYGDGHDALLAAIREAAVDRYGCYTEERIAAALARYADEIVQETFRAWRSLHDRG